MFIDTGIASEIHDQKFRSWLGDPIVTMEKFKRTNVKSEKFYEERIFSHKHFPNIKYANHLDTCYK